MRLPMFNRRSFVLFAFVLAFMANYGCSGSSMSPSPEGSVPSAVQPIPGTSVHEVAVPGASVPIRVWITAMTPSKSSQLSVGQRVSVTFSATGPDGYEAAIGMDFMSGDHKADSASTPSACDFVGVSGWNLSSQPRGETQGTWLDVNANTPLITDARFRVWVHPRGSSEWSSCANAVIREDLNLLPPR